MRRRNTHTRRTRVSTAEVVEDHPGANSPPRDLATLAAPKPGSAARWAERSNCAGERAIRLDVEASDVPVTSYNEVRPHRPGRRIPRQPDTPPLRREPAPSSIGPLPSALLPPASQALRRFAIGRTAHLSLSAPLEDRYGSSPRVGSPVLAGISALAEVTYRSPPRHVRTGGGRRSRWHRA